MDFQLSEDHQTLQKWVHEFAETEIRPVAPEYDESEEFPWPVVKKAAALCVTEPNAGSDVSALRTTARRDGDEWVLNGQKIFATNGGQAGVRVVVATVDHELGHRGQAAFIVGPDTPGIRPGKKEKKLGIRASDTSEVLLEDCRIPLENVLGGVEKLEAKMERARSK